MNPIDRGARSRRALIRGAVLAPLATAVGWGAWRLAFSPRPQPTLLSEGVVVGTGGVVRPLPPGASCRFEPATRVPAADPAAAAEGGAGRASSAGRADDSGRAGAPEPGTRAEDPARDAAALAVDLPDGRRALPVFTSAAAMTAWRPDVRPVPVDPRRAARLAVLETDRLWILDPGTRDLRLPRPAVVALADGRDWAPSWRNEPVQREIAARLGAVEGVAGVAFEPGAAVELRIFIRVEVSGGASAVAATMEACRRAMADPAWADLVDAVELCPLPERS